MKIDDMEAGREMDALIAKVMGEKIKYGCFVDDGYEDECVINVIDCTIAEAIQKDGEKFPDNCKYWRAIEPSPYSTDIAAAWEVVEKMLVNNWKHTINVLHDFRFTEPTRHCCFRFPELDFDEIGWIELPKGPGKYLHFHGYGETTPLAICRAALKAIGVCE